MNDLMDTTGIVLVTVVIRNQARWMKIIMLTGCRTISRLNPPSENILSQNRMNNPNIRGSDGMLIPIPKGVSARLSDKGVAITVR